MVTHELRWFVAQAISDDELRSFAASNRLEHRCDSYLRSTDAQRGIKQRGGAELEDKRRIASHAMKLEFGGRAVHLAIERWHKRWPREFELEPEIDHGEWIDVYKRRATLVRDDCRVELTGLRVALDGIPTREFQSLAFETLSTDDPLATISRCARSVLIEHPELLMRISDQPSVGYPAWLASLAG